ncbi:MAG: hypothetical protein O7E49_14360 [Gemmatimonadetes bacterium]|nr:hypothetical protein [Gemmatimonadota bacterium]
MPRLIDNQRGVALITVLLVSLAVSSVAIAATMMTMSGTLVRKYSERTAISDQAALSGVERGLSALLGDGTLLPVSGFTTLEDSVAVYDAMGNPIPGVRRSIYLGPSSDPSRASIVSEVWTRGGVRAVRRMEVQASSFASYGYFVDDDENNIGFNRNDDIFGPVHFNDPISIWSAGASDSATFWGEVTTTATIVSPGYGSFRKGYNENVSNIPLPEISSFAGLETMASNANLRFSSTLGPNSAPMRLEFIAVDMDGDTTTTNDIEGFVRVYTTSEDRPYTIAAVQGGSPLTTPNCGVWNDTTFRSFENTLLDSIAAKAAIDSNRYRCYLGGDPILNDGTFSASIGPGNWVLWGGAPVPNLSTVRPSDYLYLHPYTSALNSNSAGVIYVDGDVGVSGVVAGRVTVVAADDIIIVDDLVQYTDPGQNACAADMLGLIAFDVIVIADNTLNTPQRYPGGGSYHTMDDTKDEFVHAVAMALSEFRVHNAQLGPDDNDNGGFGAEPCEGIPWGRGCLYLTGGILQGKRGRIGEGTGHLMRHSFNQCVLQGGPPQFPATGSFSKRRVVEMDAANFDPVTWFAGYQS